ncbi:MAG: hypothetical protein RL316_644, partial [Bacteroidota bacterium]
MNTNKKSRHQQRDFFILKKSIHYQPSIQAKMRGATIVASL